MGCVPMYRHGDGAARLPGEEVDKPEGKTESAAEGWRPGSWDPEGRAGPSASPGVVLHDCVLGKAEEGGAEVHAHRRVPAATVVLEGPGGGGRVRAGTGERTPYSPGHGTWGLDAGVQIPLTALP